MSKTKVGNKENSIINGQWAKHVKRWWKKYTSGKRRIKNKQLIKREINEKE